MRNANNYKPGLVVGPCVSTCTGVIKCISNSLQLLINGQTDTIDKEMVNLKYSQNCKAIENARIYVKYETYF